MKRSREDTSTAPSKRQQGIAGFFTKPKKVQVAQEIKDEVKDDIIDITSIDDIKSEPDVPIITHDTAPKPDLIGIGTDDYPPPSHTSYHLPPSPSYNHPFPPPPIAPSLSSSLRFNTASQSIAKPTLGLDLLYFKPFIERKSSKELAKFLLDTLPWYRVTYTVRGITINTPRWTTVFGKDSTKIPWTGYKCAPKAIPPILLRLMQRVEEVTGETYNFILVNYYSTGSDSISYHSDSESFLGPNPCIASISLASPRDFTLRHTAYKTNNAPIEKFTLESGDMVVMRGRTQHEWQHSVPKRAKAEERINITFRKGVVEYATRNYNQYNVGSGGMYRWVGGEMVEQK